VPVIANFLTESVLAVGTGPALHPRRPLVFATILQGWTRRKNPEAALKAFALVRKEMPECGLVMIGANYEPHGPAAQWARENSLDAGVTFAGLIPYAEMLVYVRGRVDAVVMPSLDEALSMTALEAMALGKPIVAGDSTPGMMEILDGGKAGLLVNVTRPQEIAQAMLLLQNDPDVYETFTDNAYRRAHTAYRAETIVPQYERMYSSFLAKHAV
jgi:glycosyltransferase involved in cell wall biosynthesis